MSTDSESSIFRALFQAACEEYNGRSGTNISEHPFAIQLQECHSIESLIALLQRQARGFREFQGRDGEVVILPNHTYVPY
jgi:hypothetical protein